MSSWLLFVFGRRTKSHSKQFAVPSARPWKSSKQRSGCAQVSPRYLTVVRLIDSTPPLLAASLRYVYENGDAAVGVLAERENVDPDLDRRPWLLIAIFGALTALVHREWRNCGRGDAEDMLRRFDAYANDLGPTIAGRWNPSRRPVRKGRPIANKE